MAVAPRSIRNPQSTIRNKNMASGIVEPSTPQESQEQQSKAPKAGERSKLVQRLLDGGPNLQAYLTDLLTTQAVTVAGTEAAGFVIERGEQQFNLRPIAHIRPDDSDAKTRQAAIAAFQEFLRPCVVQGRDGALDVGGPPNQNDESQYCLVTLLRTETEIVAVSAVITRCRTLDLARQRLVSMQLVAGYFELYNLKRQSENNRAIAISHQRVLQLSRAVADAEGFLSAAMNLCNELANAAGATRVSLGWLKGRNVKVKALSHTEEFDKKQELIVQLEKTMEECFDQECPVLHDPTGGGSDAVTRQASALSRAQGGHIVLSLPLRRHAEIEGVITLEFLPTVQLGPKVMEDLALAVDLLAPQLYDRHENDRWLITKAALSAEHVLEETLGPRHWVAKLITGGVIILLLILTNFLNLLLWAHVDIRPTYRVTAPFTFAAIDKRSLCAPFDGYIRDVFVRPGDEIKPGQLLATLDTSELILKKAEADSQALSHLRQADKARADNTKIADYESEMDQSRQYKAESDLFAWQIAHARITAPDGLVGGEVLKGDLTDKIGTPVKEGDELMEVAQRDRLRAELSANERDIQDIHEGQSGYLATTSLPSAKFPFTVERVIPLGQAKEANNVFTVYAKLDANKFSPSWRPGMAGEARVDVGRRTWAWIWTHRLIDFIRLKTWM
jgi:multidrug resistance efflux pump